MLLPVEVKASFDDKPLNCMNVSQSLEMLYRSTNPPLDDQVDHSSFATVSEQDDFLIPTNYRELDIELQERKPISMPVPALATVPGEVYPGPAILGDARALTGFMLQRHWLEPGGQEKTGWILFAGGEVKLASRVSVEIDLGYGLRKIDFMLP